MNEIMLILSLVLLITCGFFALFLGWPRLCFCKTRQEMLLAVSLAWGWGAGFTSVICFGYYVSGAGPFSLITWDLVVLVLLAGMSFIRLRKQNAESLASAAVTHPSDGEQNGYKAHLFCFWIFMLFSFIFFMVVAGARPHGDWDAWAIWNLRARFIFHLGPHWHDSFSSLLSWSHPDYPLLLPLTVVRLWTYAGSASVLVPALVAAIFTYATIGLLVAGISLVKGKKNGLLAGILFLLTPYGYICGSSQYADMPLAFYFLACTIFFFFHEFFQQDHFLVLAGAAASFAAWTKNEGLLFWLLVFFVIVIFPGKGLSMKRRLYQLSLFFLGSLPMMAALCYFKIRLAPSNDVVTLSCVLSPCGWQIQRVWAVLGAFIKEAVTVQRWGLLPCLLPLVLSLGGIDRYFLTRVRRPLFVFFLLSLGYAWIYIVTPYDLNWHLTKSLPRLIFQYWPSALFIFFLLRRSRPVRKD